MSDELKACPFCGNDDIGEETNGEWKGKVCKECGGSGKWDLGWSGAVENWNTRPIEDELRKELETLRKTNFTALEMAINERDVLEKKLEIAMEALRRIKEQHWSRKYTYNMNFTFNTSSEALAEIEKVGKD